jgi:lysine-N-methylase
VEQKGLSLSCEEVGRILFARTEQDRFVDHVMQDYYGDDEEEEEDLPYIDFLEWAQDAAIAILQDRTATIADRMRLFLAWCESVQDAINHYQAQDNPAVLAAWRQEHSGSVQPQDMHTSTMQQQVKSADTSVVQQPQEKPVHTSAVQQSQPSRVLSYTDFSERFSVFSQMEELDEEWINTKKEFAALFNEDSYERLVLAYLSSPDYSALGYEHLLVYFVFRYLMNAAYDYDILTYGKLVIVSTLVVRDMDVARFCRNGGTFAMFDRIDVARIFSKEVEHSEGNADDLKEMCMMEEIASVDALYRQI